MNQDSINLYIVNERPFDIMRKCKKFGSATLAKYIFGILIVSLLQHWIPDIICVYVKTSYWDVMASKLKLTEEMIAQLPELPIALLVYTFVFSGVIQLGKCLYALTYIRNNKAEYSAIFESFKVFPKALLLFLIQTLVISMWSMLFFFPGVIAYYSFKQSFYILADDPKKNIFMCMAESKIRMRGNRLNLFKLQLTYSPLLLVCYLPILLVSYFATIDYSTLTGTLIGIATEIPFYAGVSLLVMGESVFYELLIQGGFSNFKYAAQDEFRNTRSDYMPPSESE